MRVPLIIAVGCARLVLHPHGWGWLEVFALVLGGAWSWEAME
jgi:hypothetical protein